ncbi:MAG: hypothetical protein ACFCU9_07515 [Cyanophyceae cyanobacterium]
MQVRSRPNPLDVIINPPDELVLEPGETQTLTVIVTNRGSRGALIEAALDIPSGIRGWCKGARETTNLAPQQIQEFQFEWRIPDQASPGQHNYSLIVDAPTHNILAAPLVHSLRLRINRPVKPTSDPLDPSFSIVPASSSQKPLEVKPGIPITLQAEVHNRSKIVDEFRLTCPDLDEEWLTIQYPQAFQQQGLQNLGGFLRLNPNTRGPITVVLNPPAEAFAGNYSPTLRVHSAVKRDLVLQDIVYLRIPTTTQLQIELRSVLDRVKHKAAEFELTLTNRGNTIRRIRLWAEGADEDDICLYQFTSDQVQIPPGKAVKVGLAVSPKPDVKQPIGLGKQINFRIEAEALDQQVLPSYLPLASTFWWQGKAKWPYVLLSLLGLGAFVGAGILAWMYFTRPPLPTTITRFAPTESTYAFPGPIALSWEIDNPSQISSFVIEGQFEAQPQGLLNLSYTDLDGRGIPVDIADRCSLNDGVLTCLNIPTSAREAGSYQFTMRAEPISDQLTIPSASVEVVIAPPSAPVLSAIELAEASIDLGELVFLRWQITNLERVSRLDIRNRLSGRVVRSYTGEQLLNFRCLPQTPQTWQCEGLIPDLPTGSHTFDLEVVPNDQRIALTQAEVGPVQVIGTARVETFTLNRSNRSPIRVLAGDEVEVAWRVSGDVTGVRISGLGSDLPASGATILGPYSEPGRITVTLTALDSQGIATPVSNLDLEIQSTAAVTPAPDQPPPVSESVDQDQAPDPAPTAAGSETTGPGG